MAEVKWIKITTDIFDDEKILFIEQLPEADSIIVIWFKLLTLAGKINNGGVLLFRDNFPYTDEMLATIFRRQKTTVQLAIRTFEEFGMIEVINDTITIPNWSKHQSLEQLKSRNEYMKNYMRDYRQKQKELAEGKSNSVNKNVNSKVNSKPNGKSNVSEAEIRLDKDKESDRESEEESEIREDEESNQSLSRDEEYLLVEKTWNQVKEQLVDINEYSTVLDPLLKKYGVERIIKGINKIKESRYLKDNVGIGWFLSESNFVKVSNDQYKDFDTDKKDKDKTGFHNFESKTENYTNEELEKVWGSK